MRKKILAILLSVILGTSGIIYPIHSYAVLPAIIEGSVLAEALASYVGLAIGGLTLHQKVKEVFGTGSDSGGGGSHSFNVTDNGDGTISLDQDTCDQINSFYEDNYFNSVSSFNAEFFLFNSPLTFGYYTSGNPYLSSYSDYDFVSSSPMYCFYYFTDPDIKVYVVSDSRFTTYSGSVSSVAVGGKTRYYVMFDFSNSFLPLLAGEYLYRSSSNATKVTSNCNLLPVNSSDISKYVFVGNSNSKPVIFFYEYGLSANKNYYVSNFNPVTTNVKFKKDVISNTDWTTVNNNNYNKVVNNINEGTNLTPDQIKQIVIDSNKTTFNALQGIQSTLNDASKDIESILSEIKVLHLDQNTNFTQIINILQNGGSGSGIGGSDYSSQLTEIITNLKLITDNTKDFGSGTGGGSSGTAADQIDYRPRLDQIIFTLEDLLDRVDDLNVLVDKDENNNNFFDLMKLRFSDSGDLMSKRFPTSVPWDIAHAFKMFKADPVAPEFHIPIKSEKLGITETIDIDLSDNSTVSNMTPIANTSRTLLTGLFIMFLIALTRKLFGGDK